MILSKTQSCLKISIAEEYFQFMFDFVDQLCLYKENWKINVLQWVIIKQYE